MSCARSAIILPLQDVAALLNASDRLTKKCSESVAASENVARLQHQHHSSALHLAALTEHLLDMGISVEMAPGAAGSDVQHAPDPMHQGHSVTAWAAEPAQAAPAGKPTAPTVSDAASFGTTSSRRSHPSTPPLHTVRLLNL